MNLLELVPSFRRQLQQYINPGETDSKLAAYLADAIDALNWRWLRSYVVTNPSINTYLVEPSVTPKDKWAITLMASVIYKGSNLSHAKFSDGDFAYDPQTKIGDIWAWDFEQLEKLLPAKARLFMASTTPLRGFSNWQNRESYNGWIWRLIT